MWAAVLTCRLQTFELMYGTLQRVGQGCAAQGCNQIESNSSTNYKHYAKAYRVHCIHSTAAPLGGAAHVYI